MKPEEFVPGKIYKWGDADEESSEEYKNERFEFVRIDINDGLPLFKHEECMMYKPLSSDPTTIAFLSGHLKMIEA